MNKLTNQLSIFNIESSDINATWKQIRVQCPTLSEWGIDILNRGLKKHLQSIAVEPNYTCKDHRNLFSNYYSKKFILPDAFCSRLHFFSKKITDPYEIVYSAADLQEHYVGYSVIRPVAERCLGRTIIDPEKIGYKVSRGFYCLRTKFQSNIGGAGYTIIGYPYMSQDTDATVCAHTALWSVCRFLSEKFSHYQEVYPFDLIQMTGNANGRTFPYRGMTYQDYSTILSEFGCYPVILRIRDLNNMATSFKQENFYNLYSYIESGFPVLTSLPGHVIVICGHTIDFTKSVTPDADGFIQSADFVKQMVVVDDNFFPYALLGSPNDPDNYGSGFTKKFSLNDIHTAVCPLPEKAFLPAECARQKAIKYFKFILPSGLKPPFVMRLLLTTCGSFKKRKLSYFQKTNDPLLSFPLSVNFPHFIWVAELYTVDDYKNGRCFAEIALDATAGLKENGTLYIRAENELYFDGNHMHYPSAPKSFVQYTHNLGEASV